MQSNNKVFTRSFIAVSLAAALVGTPALAAESGGSIKGLITNNDGVSLQGATITLKHKTKGFTKTINTNNDGEYTLRNLPVGDYSLVVTKDGFQQGDSETISIQVGQPIIFDGALVKQGQDLEVIQVRGSSFRRIDTSNSTAGMTITQQKLEVMPIDSGFENMALLTPGTVRTGAAGDVDFRNASSFGGSSSAENGYYLNGLNVSFIKTGLGAIRLPWEAISQTQIKTGGINPEFGGALGGIVNAVTKSGENEFKFGAQVRIDPDSLRTQHDSVFRQDGSTQINQMQSSNTFSEYQVWASGPIIEDKAFFYALFNPRKSEDTWGTNSAYRDRTREEDRWLVKLDWYINENHSIDVTAINNERDGVRRNYAYNVGTNTVGDYTGDTISKDGGKVYGFHYNGQLTDDFSVDFVWGRVEETVYNTAVNTLPLVQDCRLDVDNCVTYSSHSDSTIYDEEYVRDQFKLDFHYDLDDHSFQFGIDHYKIDVLFQSKPNGIDASQGWWSTRIATEDDRSGVAAGEAFIRKRVRIRGSDSDSTSTAYYLQDSWQATDELTLNLGVRYSEFENTANGGPVYADLKEQIAPRIQAIWDVNGDGESKLFATYGRYFQPISANMNITQGSSSYEFFEYYQLSDVDATGLPTLSGDGSPNRGAQIGGLDVRQQGIVDPNLIASGNLKSMYADEFTLGYETEVFGDMTAGVRGIYRDLKRSIEDSDVGPVLAKYLEANGIEDNLGQSSYYVLFNPGENVNIAYDFDGDGNVDNVNLSSSELLLPDAVRKYLALEATLAGQVTDRLRIDASYTWSHSYGNTEGLVKTDNTQADPGWTTSYDYADLMDHGYGDLPNDHRHALKLSGTYDITDELTFGFVGRMTAGRPQSIFSVHPAGVDSCATGNPWDACISRYYGNSSHYDENGNPAPRGSKGNLPWLNEIDLSLTYKTQINEGDFMLKGTVYNLLGADKAVDIVESAGPDYGLTEYQQQERYVSIVARYEF